jgi:uncharacterized protein (TIGR01777 family)
MQIVIAGGTGFLGSPLTSALLADGHGVAVLSRNASARVPQGARVVPWDPHRALSPWTTEIDGADVVINMAGEPIADHRWTAAQKQCIEDSRIVSTRRLAEAITQAAAPPAVFINGSGVGFYGPCGSEIVTEETGAGTDFLGTVCRRWEAQAVEAASPRTRVVCVRTGLVLGTDGGALRQMLLPFKLGAGGRLGSGQQYWPWIHRRDWIDLVRFAIEHGALAGPMNATAPQPVTNAEFTRALARALKRPAVFPVPAVALRILLGEMADALLLTGQRAVPAKAQHLGFTFRFASLDAALADLFPGAGR